MSPTRTSPHSPYNGKHTILDDRLNFNSAVAFLSEKTRQADIHVLSPLRAIFKDAFKNYPTATSYFMVFCALSLLPITCFVGFSLFATSALLAMSLFFVMAWGGTILGSALIMLLASLAVLAVATFWIVLGLFSTIFIFRIIYNIQTVFVHKLKNSQVMRDMTQHIHERRLPRYPVKQETDDDNANMSLAYEKTSSP